MHLLSANIRSRQTLRVYSGREGWGRGKDRSMWAAIMAPARVHSPSRRPQNRSNPESRDAREGGNDSAKTGGTEDRLRNLIRALRYSGSGVRRAPATPDARGGTTTEHCSLRETGLATRFRLHWARSSALRTNDAECREGEGDRTGCAWRWRCAGTTVLFAAAAGSITCTGDSSET
jgi:hypothetical protein